MENLSQDIKSAMLYSSFTFGAISYPFQYASYSPSDIIPSENLKSQYVQIEMPDFKELQDKVTDHEARLKGIETKLDERFHFIQDKLINIEKGLENIKLETRKETRKIAKLETDVRWIKLIGGFLVSLIISAILAIGAFILWLFKNGYLQIIFSHPNIK